VRCPPYLVEEAREGDGFEVRGPIGGYFVWEDDRRPVFLVGGGSGVVPLMAMIRSSSGSTPIRLLYSSRTLEDVIYRQELEDRAGHGLEVFQTLTREQPPGWTGYGRRIDEELLREVAWPAGEQPHVFICGSTRFVDAARRRARRPRVPAALDQDRTFRSDRWLTNDASTATRSGA
jgi:NAD(P)H-flavin reductase